MEAMQQLIAAVRQEAQRETFPIDTPVYEAAGLDPMDPVLYYGDLESDLCFFARDLGKDEVHAKQPLYGAAGSLVRQGVRRVFFGDETKDPEKLQEAAGKVLLTNTVPYKPPGNKAYSVAVKKRFRAFLERLLVFHWKGSYIISLGNEAFKWFAPYTKDGSLDYYFSGGDRYNTEIDLCLSATDESGNRSERKATLFALPHPSPLNQKYYHQFPGMLLEKLVRITGQGGELAQQASASGNLSEVQQAIMKDTNLGEAHKKALLMLYLQYTEKK